MKNSKQINNFCAAILFAVGIGFSNISIAATCTSDTSPSAACDNLKLTTSPLSTISIDYTVTGTAGGTPALTIQSGVTSGSISIGVTGTLQNLSTSGTGIINAGSINSLINNGIINAPASGGDGILIGGGTSIGSLVNSGSIAGGRYAIHNNGTITELTNTATTGSPTSGIYGSGTSGSDILNAGTIGTLNNAQSNTSLVLYGNLPTYYNIIINSPTSYGTFTARSINGGGNPTGGPMTFGIYPTSIVPMGVTSYANVLDGIPDTRTKLSATSGVMGGGLVTTTWILSNPSSAQLWNLQTTKTVNPTSAINVVGSSAGTNLAYVFAGQAANTTVQSNGVSVGAAVSGLSQTQVNQLQNVHAEGYSSNMTIGLEQMAHITNTVMDRIHAPMSSSPSTKVYQDDEGRYIWADAAAVKGTVNNYNNLAGFGYNLYDVIFGGDIKRSKDGGFGVFAGTGSTSMTESQQVTQNFNTTNFYAGLYGALNFAEQVKLSGALGYMYGSTNANRSAPNVGDLVGGNATSSFKSNGVYVAAKLAKAYQAESFTVSPFVGASYSQLWMGGASEQGGNTFNYGINSASAYTAVTFAGTDFIYPLLKGTNDPLSLIGFYKFGYDWYANSASAHTVTATTSFSGSTQSFAQVGANMGPVSNMVGLGIQGGITKEISARIGAVASYNTYGHEYGGGAELRFKF